MFNEWYYRVVERFLVNEFKKLHWLLETGRILGYRFELNSENPYVLDVYVKPCPPKEVSITLNVPPEEPR